MSEFVSEFWKPLTDLLTVMMDNPGSKMRLVNGRKRTYVTLVDKDGKEIKPIRRFRD